MYQSHKGWTSNLLNIKLNLNYKEYQSHKGWTSNNINDLSWDELTNRINPTRGGRQTLYLQLCIYSLYFVSIQQGVDVKPHSTREMAALLRYQSHKGWTSNFFCVISSSIIDSINPTRGGRQTLQYWPLCLLSECVSIPQ